MSQRVNEGGLLVGADSRRYLTVPIAALISYNENKRIGNQEESRPLDVICRFLSVWSDFHFLDLM